MRAALRRTNWVIAHAARRREERAVFQCRLRYRDELVLANLGILSGLAAGVLQQTASAAVDRADLVGAGTLRMIAMAENFDARRGASFADYARRGVRGAMWELVRRRNWKNASHASLDSTPNGDADAPQVADARQTPDELLETSRRTAAAHEALLILSARERYVVTMYYAEHDLGEIGKALGIGASMASRVHRQALAKMQEHFRMQGRKAA